MRNSVKYSVGEAQALLTEARERARNSYENHMLAKVTEEVSNPRVQFVPVGNLFLERALDAARNPEAFKMYMLESVYVECAPDTEDAVYGYIMAVWYDSSADEVMLDVCNSMDGKLETVLAGLVPKSESICEFLNKYDNAGIKY